MYPPKIDSKMFPNLTTKSCLLQLLLWVIITTIFDLVYEKITGFSPAGWVDGGSSLLILIVVELLYYYFQHREQSAK